MPSSRSGIASYWEYSKPQFGSVIPDRCNHYLTRFLIPHSAFRIPHSAMSSLVVEFTASVDQGDRPPLGPQWHRQYRVVVELAMYPIGTQESVLLERSDVMRPTTSMRAQ